MRPSSECPVTRPELSRQRPRQAAPLLALQVQAMLDDTRAAGDGVSSPASLPQALAPGHGAGPSGPDFLTRCRRSVHQVVPRDLSHPGLAVRIPGCKQESLQTTRELPAPASQRVGLWDAWLEESRGGERGEGEGASSLL